VSASYTRRMFERTTTRALPLVNRASEHAPMATACCNACRTCITNNILGLLGAGAVAVVSFLRRSGKPS
jgi:hypothetical protein